MGEHGKHRPLVIRASLIGLAFMASAAQAAECRLALVLAMDVSNSVDRSEDRLQRDGLVSALNTPVVRKAFFASDQSVALAVYEWSGVYHQHMMLEWTLIDGPEALDHAIDTLAASVRSQRDFPTAMGRALEFGAELFERAPSCLNKTLDMAGDGQNNKGFGPATAYARFGFDEITVNGLVVNAGEFEAETGLIAFYQAEVLHGPGAFIEIAQGFEDYERAMRRKLERELSPPVIGVGPTAGDLDKKG